MPIEIRSIGGYNEVGKNMTAIRVDNEVVILDMGIHLENYIRLTEDEDLIKFGVHELTEAGAVPDISLLEDWRSLVKAIIPTHAHLDHVGAIPYIADRFAAPIICTPFTAEVIEAILRDEKIKLKNEIKRINQNSVYEVSDTISVEFLNSTHSTPHTVIAVIHTPYGKILYANDFKFDMYPTLGKKPNIKRLKELGESGDVLLLIVDSTYAWDWRKMPSESVAREMLKDVLLGTDSTGKLIVATTFSSHLARLNSMVKFAKKLDRKILILGRSMAKYIEAGEKAGLIDFSDDVEIIRYSRKVKKKLREVAKTREKYFLIVTGHQGEPKAMLSRMVRDEFDFVQGDHVVFSCTVIPTETTILNRKELEAQLKQKGVRIFKDIHVSGHAAREDLRDLICMVKPLNIIPAHGTFKMTSALVDLAKDIGYESENLHLIQNGDFLSLKL